MMKLSASFWIRTIIGFGLVACARTAAPAASPTEESTQGESTQPLPSELVNDPLSGMDLDDPILNGEQAASLDEAQSHLAFKIVGARAIGDPYGIFVTGPLDTEDGDDFRRYTWGDVVEAPAQLTEQEWEKAAATAVGDVGQPGYYGSAVLEPLDSGSPVLVTTTPDGSISIAEWVQGGVDIAVLGPALQSDQAKTIAKAISAA